MSKHRPGPWILSESSVLRYGETKPTQICEIFCKDNNKVIADIPDYCYHADDAEEDRADARLIAAAPCLLEALQAARLFISNGIELGYITMPDADTQDPAHATLPMIDAAIAKATGGDV